MAIQIDGDGIGVSALSTAAKAELKSGRKNLIINGAMQVAQRGTSASGKTTTGYYSPDRWRIVLNTIGTYTISQDTSAPAGFANSWKIVPTTADASPTGADAASVDYSLEGQDVQSLMYGTSSAKTVTLSFWVKSNKTGVGQVNLRNIDANRIISGTYTISAADTWEQKTITFAGDTSNGFTNDNGKSLLVEWWLDGGSDYNTGAAPTAWEAMSNTDRNVAGTLAIADSTANNFYITGVQLEVGDTATDFEHRSYGEELALCQRYYYRMLGNPTGGTGDRSYCYQYNASYKGSQWNYPVTMRAVPSISYTANGGVTGSLYTSENGTGWYVASGTSDNTPHYITDFYADAEL